MSLLQWALLVGAVAAVLLFYWRARRRHDEDPWKQSGSTEATGKILQPDYEKLDPQGSVPLPVVQTATAAQADSRPVVVDPSVQGEYSPQAAHGAAGVPDPTSAQ